MSHVNIYKARILDKGLFASVLQKNGASDITTGRHTIKQFGSNKVDCVLSAKLPGWRYQIGVKENGDIAYDHFGSEPNTMDHLGEAIQDYYVEAIKQTADYTMVTGIDEYKLENGDVQLVVNY